MNQTTYISVLTPKGSGAIATIAIYGSDSWNILHTLFRSSNQKPLPEYPVVNQVYFGHLGEGFGDEVIISIKTLLPVPYMEIHCHGGQQVIGWLLEQLQNRGCVEQPWVETFSQFHAVTDARALALLPYTKTLRTAQILMDQVNGAYLRFERSLEKAKQQNDHVEINRLLKIVVPYIHIGRRLVQPWKVTVVGAVNTGKSSLMNALAGFQRSVVASVPGTTRDIVSVTLAINGWLMEISDTAGLRETEDQLEHEGIQRVSEAVHDADLVLWLLDTATRPVGPTVTLANQLQLPRDRLMFVMNKSDLKPVWDVRQFSYAAYISAKNGEGIDRIIQQILDTLIPEIPPLGTPIPFTDVLCQELEEWLH